jgi:hypothetical protein
MVLELSRRGRENGARCAVCGAPATLEYAEEDCFACGGCHSVECPCGTPLCEEHRDWRPDDGQ